MGTPLSILIYETRTDEQGNHYNIPFVVITRSIDGPDAYDTALEFCSGAQIVNGTFYEKPAWQHNGVGAFVLALYKCLAEGYEDHTTLRPTIDYVDLEGNPDPDFIADEEIQLIIWCQDTHNNEGLIHTNLDQV